MVALVAVTAAAGAAVAGGAAPLRLQLVPGHGEATIHLVVTSGDKVDGELDMHLPWTIDHVGAGGTASVRIGPPTFSGKAPPWPKGGYAEFELSPDNRDHDWTTGLPPGAPADEMTRLQEILSPQYSTAVGIVRLPSAPVEVGASWSREEREHDAGGLLVTRYAYRLLERSGKRIRVAIDQSTQREGGDKPVTIETVRGEVAYELGKPLPVGGWLEKSWRDGRFRYLYR